MWESRGTIITHEGVVETLIYRANDDRRIIIKMESQQALERLRDQLLEKLNYSTDGLTGTGK